ncbi:hypothetical protein [Cohnella cellulosilytica]|uniref:Uncharacterized protein n=1 Tax=Cohnella cellulosilytica TaxID=986710 RepID=A0ABW2FKL4_9BACL
MDEQRLREIIREVVREELAEFKEKNQQFITLTPSIQLADADAFFSERFSKMIEKIVLPPASEVYG